MDEETLDFAYLLVMASLIKELEDCYNKVVCRKRFDVPGTLKIDGLTVTYDEQIQLIDIFLRKVREGVLTYDEENIIENTELKDGLLKYNLPNFIKPLIAWLKMTLKYQVNSL